MLYERTDKAREVENSGHWHGLEIACADSTLKAQAALKKKLDI